MKTGFWIAALVAAGLAGAPAHAAMTVMGGGMAETCSKAALAGKADMADQQACDFALANEILTAEEQAGTYVNRGVMKLRRGEYEAAHADFDAGIALAPKIGEAWVNRGAMFVGEKQYHAGLQDLNKGIELGSKEPEKAYFNRALAYEGLDDEKDAYLDYEQALVIKPGWNLPQHELLRFTVTRR